MHKNAHFDMKSNKNYLFVIFITKILANIKLFIVNLHRKKHIILISNRIKDDNSIRTYNYIKRIIQ